MKFICYFSLFFVNFVGHSQVNYDHWNQNYIECSVDSVIKSEIAYTDSVTSGLISSRFYTRMDTYRFKANYLGCKRKIEKSTIDDLKIIYRLNGGATSQMEIIEQIKNEYLFNIEGKDLWIPMQLQAENKFKHKIKANTSVFLYCLFFNLYVTTTGVGNWFLVSEFHDGECW